MVNVKSYTDGDRRIIVIENCTGELSRKVGQFLLDLYGVKVDPTPIPAVEPIEVVEEAPPDIEKMQELTPNELAATIEKTEIENYLISNGQFQGMKLDEAFEKGGVQAAIELSLIANKEDSAIKDELIVRCKKRILEDLYLREPETATPHEIKEFFENFKPFIKEGIQQILEMQGHPSVESFLEFGDVFVQQEAYKALIDGLKERIEA